MLNSKAYINLPQSAAKALPYFLGKVKKPFFDPERYLQIFELSYGEADRYGFACSTFSNVIQALVRHGFIDPVDKGGLRSDGKSYNKFRLSKRWENYEQADFEKLEWRCFVPKPRLKATSKSEIDSFRI